MDIEKYLNNRPLTYIESDFAEEVLTTNVIMFSQNARQIDNIEVEDDEVTKMFKGGKTTCLAALEERIST